MAARDGRQVAMLSPFESRKLRGVDLVDDGPAPPGMRHGAGLSKGGSPSDGFRERIPDPDLTQDGLCRSVLSGRTNV